MIPEQAGQEEREKNPEREEEGLFFWIAGRYSIQRIIDFSSVDRQSDDDANKSQ